MSTSQRVGDGVPIILTKVEDKGVYALHPISTGYWIKALMWAPPIAGQPFRCLRTERPARDGESGERTVAPGEFETTPVESVEQGPAPGQMVFRTANSCYLLQIVLDETASMQAQ